MGQWDGVGVKNISRDVGTFIDGYDKVFCLCVVEGHAYVSFQGAQGNVARLSLVTKHMELVVKNKSLNYKFCGGLTPFDNGGSVVPVCDQGSCQVKSFHYTEEVSVYCGSGMEANTDGDRLD